MATVTATSNIICRRCGQPFALDESGHLLPACPHCGAAPVALWRRMQHNGLAAMLALVAMIVLAVSMTLPFISMSKFGSVRIFSLIGGILELFHAKQIFLALVLFVFSVIFPFAKLIALLAATSRHAPLSQRARRFMVHAAHFTGRYSFLDILVVAVMIIVVKFRGVAEVRAQSGTILFCVAIFLSILAGFCVNLRSLEGAAHDGK
jgi:paraquat-inducible protein A